MSATDLLLECTKVYRDDDTGVVYECPGALLWADVRGLDAPDGRAVCFADWENTTYVRCDPDGPGCYVRGPYAEWLARWKVYLQRAANAAVLLASQN